MFGLGTHENLNHPKAARPTETGDYYRETPASKRSATAALSLTVAAVVGQRQQPLLDRNTFTEGALYAKEILLLFLWRKEMMQVRCGYCNKAIERIDGYKPRIYCKNDKCRKQASRERREEKKRTELMARWNCLPPPVTECLKTILTKFGFEAASLVTDAIETLTRTLQPPLGPREKQP